MSALRYLSTRGRAPAATLSEAIAAGLAPDGGLYVPERLPSIDLAAFDSLGDLAATASTLLAPFFAGDPLADALPAICAEAFAFDAPLRPLARPDASLLELFHGPTAAFKDFGARFLAACLRRLRAADAPPLTILVATSGDTGAAVGAAFHQAGPGPSGVRVAILYPDGRVSPRQAHQLGSFGDNVHALRVAGSFDDCQRMVKAALNDPALRREVPLSSANSISLGRLLPQMSYYAHAALRWHRNHRAPLGFIVPTGNLGNALACLWARRMGLPIGDIRLACNANPTLPEFFAGADYRPRDAAATLANAMDVGAPSNFERLRWSFDNDDHALRHALSARSVDDATIRATLLRHARDHGEIVCPHTATALALLEEEPQGDAHHWAVVATAHPAKFEAVLEPLLGQAVPVPPALAAMLGRPSQAAPMPAEDQALAQWLRKLA
ncbi:threonine synthase [Frateuria edaphi]|nr:threonine synthase [Frateuria edaphi]UGB45495.1 threonine synthase [Frateuria edaphi]